MIPSCVGVIHRQAELIQGVRSQQGGYLCRGKQLGRHEGAFCGAGNVIILGVGDIYVGEFTL